MVLLALFWRMAAAHRPWQKVDCAVEGEQPVAAELAAALPVVDASVDDHFDGADDDDALERMVAASHARAKGSRRGGGGGGGGKKSKGGKK